MRHRSLLPLRRRLLASSISYTSAERTITLQEPVLCPSCTHRKDHPRLQSSRRPLPPCSASSARTTSAAARRYTVAEKNKVLTFRATNQISAYTLPRNYTEVSHFTRDIGWAKATNDPKLIRPLCTKLLAYVRNNVRPRLWHVFRRSS